MRTVPTTLKSSWLTLDFLGIFLLRLARIPGLTEVIIPMEWSWPYPSKVAMVSSALSAWRCKVCVVLSNSWGRSVPLFTAADLSKSCTSEYETAEPNLFSCWTMNLYPVTWCTCTPSATCSGASTARGLAFCMIAWPIAATTIFFSPINVVRKLCKPLVIYANCSSAFPISSGSG